MCGIVGWTDEREISGQAEVVTRMMDRLVHRGPDACGMSVMPHAILGHRRLAVVDLEGGAQPMSRKTEQDEYTIIYNGELYNTDELRAELMQAGYETDTRSDTEVVLLAYCCYGKDCVRHLNGIFAFAVYGRTHRTLFLARDHMGVKPLFYHQTGGKILFASEIKSLLAHPELEARLNGDGIMQLLGLGPARKLSGAVYQGIYELPPAHYLYAAGGRTEIKEYWKLTAKPHTDDYETTKEKVRTLFTDAVRRQMVSDVPLCTFLSGGLDSSAISAVAAEYKREQGETLHTFSIDYEGNDQYFQSSLFQPDSDSMWVGRASEAIGSLHTNIVLSTMDVADALPRSVEANDLPGMADVDSSLYLFCKEIKQEYTVALSGECADEIFGGYPWFTNPDMIAADTFPWAQSVEERTRLLAPSFSRLPLREYIDTAYRDTIDRVPVLEGESPESRRLREISFLNLKWFMRTLLSRKDRMSMAHSLEVRVPFADYRIVEYAFQIPMEMKYHDGREKGLLRDALSGLLPEDVLWRKKSPFPKTHHPVFYSEMKKRLSARLKDTDAPMWSIVNHEYVSEILETDGKNLTHNFFGQLMTVPQLMAYLISIDDWLRTYQVKIVK